MSDEAKIDGDRRPRALRYPPDSPREGFWLFAEPPYDEFDDLHAARISRGLDEFEELVEARVRAELAEQRDELIKAILTLHSPRPVGPHRPGVLQCGYCADLCHSHSGLGCEDDGDALYPCETVEITRAAAGSSRDTTPAEHCCKCGLPLSRCSQCAELAQCGDDTCAAHSPDTTPEAKP